MNSSNLKDIFKLVFATFNFIIKASNDFTVDLENWEINATELKVYKLVDSKEIEVTGFGETFAGYQLDTYDFVCYVVASYLSGATFMKFEYVDEAIIKLKNDTFISMGKAGLDNSGRSIPQEIYNSSLEKLTLDLYWQADGSEYIAYIGENEGVCALVNAEDGSLITDYDNFYIEGILQDIKKPDFKVICHSSNIVEVLKDYGVEI